MPTLPTGTVTFLFTDIEGSTRLAREHPEAWETARVRFRTIGDMTCTGAVESPANNLDDIINEIAISRTTERGTRADDKRSEAAMEDRKKEGYF